MRPHRLRVQAFGAFAGTEQVTFDDLEGLFLLHGETGAGKTTLLDAIAFALYGRVPGERGNAKRLRSDHAAPGLATEVELEATIGTRRLRITRKPEQERPKRSGTGATKEPASVRLDELAASGTWESKSTRVVEADQEIRDLMGMSADQFFQVVLLPQGQFAQFLHAKAQDKEALLQKLFSTDRFRAVERWLSDRRLSTEKEAVAATGALSLLVAQVAQVAGVPVPDEMPDQAVWVAALSAQAFDALDAAAAVAAVRESDLHAKRAAQTQADQLAARQRRRRDARRRQAESEAVGPAIELLRAEVGAAGRAAEVAAVLDAADRAMAVAESARHAETQGRAALPDSLRSASADVLRAAGQERQEQAGHLEALRAVARQAAIEDKAVEDAGRRAAQLAQDLQVVEAEAARRHESRPQAQDARDAASRAATDLPAAHAQAETARRVATDSAALVKARAKRERLREAHVTTRERLVELREKADDLHRARIDGMAAELALTMTDDSPCPVCGSFEHPNPVEPTFEPVSREQEDAANALVGKASQEAEVAGQQVAAANAVIDGLARGLTEAGFVFPAAHWLGSVSVAGSALPGSEASISPGDALSTDPEALAAAARQAQADAKRLADEAGRLQSAAASLEDLQRKLGELDEAIAGDKVKLVELSEQRAATLAEAEAATKRAAGHRSELRAKLGDAPDLDAALRAARQLAESLTGAADNADETARTEADGRDARQRAAIAAIGAGFGMAAEADNASDEASAVAAEMADAVATGAARTAFRDSRWRSDAADRIKRHEAEAEAVATLLSDPDLDIPLDPPAPVAETAEVAAEAQRAHDAANGAHATAKHTSDQLALLKPRIEDALAALAPLSERADQIRQIADLANGNGANRYRMTLSSFVLAARLEEVAQAASERLLTMTAGRFSLAHSDARKGNAKAGLSLLACDSWTGIDRDTATLSGGETFLASLALALGLADVVTAEAAGTPMEALFVDEGFGTLDEDTLDEVMNVLDGLREGGRIVGIVSHVAELRQRIPSRVHVAKGRHGSHVTVTGG